MIIACKFFNTDSRHYWFKLYISCNLRWAYVFLESVNLSSSLV